MTWASRRWPVLFLAAIMAVINGCSNSPSISVSVSAHSPAVDQGQATSVTATVTNDHSNRGVSWSLNGPGSLSTTTGLSVTYNSPSTTLTSPQQVTLTATSQADKMKTASIQITVNPYPRIPFQNIASGSAGTPYSQTILLMGGTAPFQWSIYNGPIETGNSVAGTVPDGLTLNGSTDRRWNLVFRGDGHRCHRSQRGRSFSRYSDQSHRGIGKSYPLPESDTHANGGCVRRQRNYADGQRHRIRFRRDG
jgi:hypothetical protein